MEILEKCIFYNINSLIQFKRRSIFQFGLMQANESSIYFTNTDTSFKVAVPSLANFGYFAHIVLQNGFNLAYQPFLIEKLAHIDDSSTTTALTESFNAKKLVLIFDLNTSWVDSTVKDDNEKISKRTIKNNGTLFVRISFIDILKYIEQLDEELTSKSALEKFVLFLQKSFLNAKNIQEFFKNINIDLVMYSLTAIIFDNINVLGVYEEPQNIELSRRRRKTWDDGTQDNDLVMVDVFKSLHQKFGCLIITTGFDRSNVYI
ncbi:hypothetical protein QEN19_002549 [Hanseniaspora menglaensis]